MGLLLAGCGAEGGEAPPRERDTGTFTEDTGVDPFDDGIVDEDVFPEETSPPMPSCTNGLIDGDETDVDCGGSCGKCDPGRGCASASDCAGGVCSKGLCAAPSCTDGAKNGDETDIDCGGSCGPCADG
ncbi:MAG: hypothetical protein ACXVEF_44740, partial [Polyangiales bacterium]